MRLTRLIARTTATPTSPVSSLMSSRVDKFYLPNPSLPNAYTCDAYFRSLLQRHDGPSSRLSALEPQLSSLGARCAGDGDITKLGVQAEANPPHLVQYGPFGARVDDIQVSAAWDKLKDISAELGLVAEGYDRKKWGDLSRLVQFSKMYLFYSASAVFSCPLAMTDGAARLLEVYGGDFGRPIFEHLVSRDPASFWTSGQHMTERTGGSDLSNSETIAREQPDGTYKLFGYKFFTSATTSEMAIGLARTVDRNGVKQEGTKGLSCFFVRMQRNSEGALDGILVHRLKEKLGTKAVPTAELEFTGCPAVPLGPLNRGVPVISSLFNITRWQNAVWCLSAMRRAVNYAREHARLRSIGNVPLSQKPLHLETLADLELETRAAAQLVAHVSVLLGRDEAKTATSDEDVTLRMLTPLAKLYVAKQAMYVISEAIECVGGVGYTEQTPLPQLLRDAQVTTVWEGTTNVLSLDVWRPITKQNGLAILAKDIEARLTKSALPETAAAASATKLALREVISFAKDVSKLEDNNVLEASARSFSYSLSRIYMSSLLLEHAHWSRDPVDVASAFRWVTKQPLSIVHDLKTVKEPSYQAASRALALGSKL